MVAYSPIFSSFYIKLYIAKLLGRGLDRSKDVFTYLNQLRCYLLISEKVALGMYDAVMVVYAPLSMGAILIPNMIYSYDFL